MERGRKWCATERAAIWERRRRGLSLVETRRLIGCPTTTVFRVVRDHGGFVRRRRKRPERVLQVAEREEISRGLAAGRSVRDIARQIGRAPSTPSREIRRHGGREAYRAADADACAWASQAPAGAPAGALTPGAQMGGAQAAAGLVAEADRGWPSPRFPEPGLRSCQSGLATVLNGSQKQGSTGQCSWVRPAGPLDRQNVTLRVRTAFT